MRNVLKITIVAALLSPLAIIIAAQNQPLAFEVASVKPNNSTGGSYYVGCYTPASTRDLIPKGMCIARGATLHALIAEANGIITFNNRDYLKGGPDWISSDRYDIQGKAENMNSTTNELRTMLRNLLAERFKLRVHEEMKDAAGYAIVLGKNGPKLAPTAGDKPRSIAAFGQPPTELEGMNASMSDLATYFVRQFHRPFVDQTGLIGRYDFRMTLLADDSPPITDAPLKAPPGTRIVFGLNDSALPAVSKALQEQLGLRLEAQKLPMPIIVIDHAEKPSEN